MPNWHYAPVDGLLITLTEQRWLTHIMLRHPEVTEADVAQALTAPERIYEDRIQALRRVYQGSPRPSSFFRGHMALVVVAHWAHNRHGGHRIFNDPALSRSVTMALIMRSAWELDYDAEGDVLYASRGAPQPAASVEVGDDVWLRYVPGNPDVVGITILQFLEHYPRPAGRALLEHATDMVAVLWQTYPKIPPTLIQERRAHP